MKVHQNILLCIVLSVAFVLASPLIGPDQGSPTAHSQEADPNAYPAPIVVGEATNLSARGLVAGGDEAMVSSFSIQGGPVEVVMRALGPELASRRLDGVLEDPMLQILQDGMELHRNEDWEDADNAAEVEASYLAPRVASEAAILTTLEPGDYTGIMQDELGGAGIGLLEIFKAGGSGQLVEISTRGWVSQGHHALVGGLIADEVMTVLITATGPALENEGIAETLQDPVLKLRSGWRVIAENDNWEDSEHADYLIEEGLAPTDPRESAIVATIRPWGWGRSRGFTATMYSADGSGGVGQIKIQKLFE